MKLRSIQNEKDHRQGNSSDLNEEEDHDALRCQSSHVIQKGSRKYHMGEANTNVDVVTILAKVSVDEALDDNQVDDLLGDELEDLKTVVLLEERVQEGLLLVLELEG